MAATQGQFADMKPWFAFGVRGDVPGSAGFAASGKVVYAVGNNLALYSPQSKDGEGTAAMGAGSGGTGASVATVMDFIDRNPRDGDARELATGGGITAMATCATHVAVAELGDPRPIVSLYDLTSKHPRRRHTLVAPDDDDRAFIALDFDPSMKHLVTLTLRGDEGAVVLSYWSVDHLVEQKPDTEVVVSLKGGQTATVCSFNAFKPNMVCVTGDGLCHLYKYWKDNASLRPVTQNRAAVEAFSTMTILSHAWVTEDHLILGTNTGTLALVNGTDLAVASLDCDPAHYGDTTPINCIAVTSRGFMIGGDGYVKVYYASDGPSDGAGGSGGDSEYALAHTLTPVIPAPVMHIAVEAQNESAMVCVTATNQIYTLDNMQRLSVHEAADVPLAYLNCDFHHGPITGLDVCTRRSIVATCSTDATARAWNYRTGALEAVGLMPEECYSIALHPSGHIAAVGCADKLRLCNVLVGEIVKYEEVNECGMCEEVRFSRGGNMFAAMRDNFIYVFDTYTCEKLHTLQGHNGKVRAITWSPTNDLHLASAGQDGYIYEWDLTKTVKREFRRNVHFDKPVVYTGIAQTADLRTFYVVGNDHNLTEIAADQSAPARLIEARGNALYTQLSLSRRNRMMIAGCANGALRSIKYPIPGEGHRGDEVRERIFHAAGVTRVAFSHDEHWLFSAGMDGTLFVCLVRPDSDIPLLPKDIETNYADEILVSKQVLRSKDKQVQRLAMELNQEREQFRFQLRTTEQTFTVNEGKIRAELERQLEVLRGRNGNLLAEKRHLKQKCLSDIEVLKERFARERDREAAEQRDLSEAHEKAMDKMEARLRAQAAEHDRVMAVAERAHQDTKEEMEQRHAETVAALQDTIEKMGHQQESDRKMYEVTKIQIEEDADAEIQDRIEHYNQVIHQRDDALHKLKGQVAMMRRQFKQLKKALVVQKKDTADANTAVRNLEIEKAQKLREIDELQTEIDERDVTIKEKENRIHELKKKNQELEKFKFVLEYKNKELSRKLEPLKQEIRAQYEQIQEMDAELEKYYKSNMNLKLNVDNLDLKVRALEKELAAARTRLNDAHAVTQRFRTDLHSYMQFISEPKKFKEKINKLYQDHVITGNEDVGVDEDIQRESNRQREFLERSVASYKHKLNKDAHLHRTDNARIMQENVALIKEINQLRRELHELRGRHPSVSTTGGGGGGGGGQRPSPPTGGGDGMPQPRRLSARRSGRRSAGGGGGGGRLTYRRSMQGMASLSRGSSAASSGGGADGVPAEPQAGVAAEAATATATHLPGSGLGNGRLPRVGVSTGRR